jgi:hypothetical protein
MNQSAPNQPVPQAPLDPQQAEVLRQAARMNTITRLATSVRNGISNFYWIAAMSIINSLVSFFGGGVYFVIGLGATLFIDGFASAIVKDLPQYATIVIVIRFLLTLGIAGLFALFGYLGIKGQRWAIITGMVLYALDAILMLAFQDWLAVAFHAFFLWGLWNGLRASDQLRKLLLQSQPRPPQTTFPADIGG